MYAFRVQQFRILFDRWVTVAAVGRMSGDSDWLGVQLLSFTIRLGQISNNVPRKSPVGIFEEKGANNFF